MPTSPHALALALALSGVGLFGGYVLLALGRGRAAAGAIVEGLTLGLVPTMVLLRLLPHVAEGLGPWAIALVAGAFLSLRGFDQAHHRAAVRVGREFIFAALLFHSFTDGVGLAAALAAAGGHGVADLALTSAFVVHRLPEGLFIATTLMPTYGRRRTLLRILGLFAATVAGGLLGGALLPRLPERAFDAVVALGLGAMLQLVVHSHAERPPGALGRAMAALALVAGVVIALFVPAPRDLLRLAQPRELPMGLSLRWLFVATAPWLLGAIALDAILGLAPVPSPSGLGRGLALGVRLPLGPNEVAPAMRGLWAQGVRTAAVVACGLGAAALGLDALALSVPLFGAGFASTRLALAVGVVVAAAAVVGGVAITPSRSLHAHPPATPTRRWAEVLERPLRFCDQRGAWYLAGLLGAAAIEAALAGDALAGPLAGGVATALAVVLASLAPLVAALPPIALLAHKGLSPTVALALLLIAPAIPRAMLRVTGEVAGRRAALALVAVATSFAVLAATVIASSVGLPRAPDLHALLSEAHGAWAALALSALLFASLARLGPRLWLAQLTAGGVLHVHHDASDEHDDSHHHV